MLKLSPKDKAPKTWKFRHFPLCAKGATLNHCVHFTIRTVIELSSSSCLQVLCTFHQLRRTSCAILSNRANSSDILLTKTLQKSITWKEVVEEQLVALDIRFLLNDGHHMVHNTCSKWIRLLSRFLASVDLQVVGVAVLSTQGPDLISEAYRLATNKHFGTVSAEVGNHCLINAQKLIENTELHKAFVQLVIQRGNLRNLVLFESFKQLLWKSGNFCTPSSQRSHVGTSTKMSVVLVKKVQFLTSSLFCMKE